MSQRMVSEQTGAAQPCNLAREPCSGRKSGSHLMEKLYRHSVLNLRELGEFICTAVDLRNTRTVGIACSLFCFHQVSSVAAHDAAVATGAMPQILLWVSVFEAISTVAVIQMLNGSGRAPGDFGFDPYQLKKPGNEAKKVRECWCRRDHCGVQ